MYTENRHFRGNINLLNNDQTSLVCSQFAHAYWKGQQGPFPYCFWEVLLELPVTIGQRIE
ncbi:hypothetical protein GCM10027180_34830 [Microbulbifer echini]